MNLNDWEQYCPFCQRIILADNIAQVNSGEDDVDHPIDYPQEYEVMH